MMSTPLYPVSQDDGDEAVLYRDANHALELQHWPEARHLLFQLATRAPHKTRYRALLAYARGQESLGTGDESRARDEWRRALTLDPSLKEAARALAARARPRSWVDRLFGRD